MNSKTTDVPPLPPSGEALLTPPIQGTQQIRDYWCFISYRHADNKQPGRQWASWLHQAIETYEVPADLVGTVNERGDTIPERIFPVFRDEDELPADADLESPIYSALDRSKYLVVLCSPRAAQSPYVSNEIAYFKKLGRSERILAAILDGEPNSSDHPGKADAHLECFPDALRFEVDSNGNLTSERTEPIASDFRLSDGSEGWTSPGAYRQALEARRDLTGDKAASLVEEYKQRQNLMLLKILAGIMGVSVGVLTKRDQAYQLALAKKRQRVLARWLVLVGILAAVALCGLGLAVWQRQQAEAARERAIVARKSANMLIGYMQNDLSERLRPLGQIKLMEHINARIRQYYEEHPPEHTDKDVFEIMRTYALHDQGGILLSQGDFSAALEVYRESLDISAALAKKSPRDITLKQSLFTSYFNISLAFLYQDNFPEAFMASRRALVIAESLANEHPNDLNKANLASNYAIIGQLYHFQGDFPNALEAYLKSTSIVESLGNKNPNNARWQEKLCGYYNNISEVMVAQGNLTEAQNTQAQALLIAESLLERACPVS